MSKNNCHFVNSLSFASSSFFLSIRKITWLKSQQTKKSRGHVEHLYPICSATFSSPWLKDEGSPYPKSRNKAKLKLISNWLALFLNRILRISQQLVSQLSWSRWNRWLVLFYCNLRESYLYILLNIFWIIHIPIQLGCLSQSVFSFIHYKDFYISKAIK